MTPPRKSIPQGEFTPRGMAHTPSMRIREVTELWSEAPIRLDEDELLIIKAAAHNGFSVESEPSNDVSDHALQTKTPNRAWLILWIVAAVGVVVAVGQQVPERWGWKGLIVGSAMGYAVAVYPLLIGKLWSVNPEFTVRLIALSLVLGAILMGMVYSGEMAAIVKAYPAR